MVQYYYGVDFDSFRYISHHGIKGQKWGVRRFQNKDGSLTSAGEKRYNSGESSSYRMRSGSNPISQNARKTSKVAASTVGSKNKHSGRPDRAKVDEWLRENYVYYGHPGSDEYLNEYSDYDNLTVGERMMLDAEEAEELEKMEPDERRRYLERLRERQMDYIRNNVTTDKYQTDHADGRYSFIDKVREQFTGKLDADNVSAAKDSIVENRRGYLRATHKFSEEWEATQERVWTQERLDTAVRNMENNTLRRRGEKVVKKLISKIMGK